jgi:PAS domain S-box-containing protein
MRNDAGRSTVDEGRPLRAGFERLTGAAKPVQGGCGSAPTASAEQVGPKAKLEEAGHGIPLPPARLGRVEHYILALLFVLVAASMRWALGDVLSETPFLVFYLAWVAAAALGGLGPGLLATLASWFCIDFLFDPTPGHIGIDSPLSIIRLLICLAGGFAVSAVGEKMRRSRIRERRQAGELAQLARSVEGEKAILQSVMDEARNSHLVFLDRDFNFVRVNEAYARTCGYTPEEMIGQNHFALYPDAENEAIFACVRDTGVPVEFHDKPFVFPDQPDRGTTYWDWTLTPVKNRCGVVEGLVFSLFETTERKRMEEALRESEDKFKAVFNRAALGLAISDPTGLIIDCNLAYQEMLDYAKGELQQKRFLEITHPDDVDRNRDLQRQLNEGSIDTYQLEKRYLRRDGRIIWCNLIASAIRHADGTLKYNMAVAEDITERKQAEEALRESETRLRLAQQVAHIGTFEWNIQTGVDTWTPELEAMYGLSPGGFPGTQQAWEQLVHPEDRQEAARRVTEALETGSFEGEWRVVWPDGSVHWLYGRAYAFKDESGKPLKLTGVNIDITERKRAEQALWASEASLAKAQAFAHLANWELDVKTNRVRGSQELYRLFNLGPAVTLDAYIDKFHAEDRRRVVESINAAIHEGRPYSIDYRIVPRLGEVRHVHAEGEVTCDHDGLPLTFFGVVQDITERKEAEEALRESEERFRIMADGSPNPIWVTNAEGERIFANKQYLEYFGISEQEIQGGKWKPFVHPEDVPTYINSFLSSLKEHRPFSAEARVRRADGQWRWIESHAEPRLSSEGECLGFVGITQDITERKEAEAAIKESEEKYRRIVETATEAIVVVDAEAKIVFVNDRWSEIFGYSREESLGMTHLELAFPEDLPALKKRWESRKHGRKESYELRLRRKDGSPVWILVGVAPRLDPEGRFLGTLVMIADISKRKKAEEALRELNATLESRVARRTEELEHRARQLQKLTLELLHDDLQQVLAAAKFQVGLLSSRVKNDADSQEIAGQARNLLTDAITKSRNLSHELSSPALSQSDLGTALEWLAEQMQKKHGFTVHLEMEGRIEVASEPLRILLYKAAQEMLFNAIKHAAVQEAKLRLRRQRGYLRLSVSDQGRGFDPTDPGHKLGFGLLSIRERIELLGGRLKIRSAADKGSTFFVIVPDDAAGGAALQVQMRSKDQTTQTDCSPAGDRPVPSPGSP